MVITPMIVADRNVDRENIRQRLQRRDVPHVAIVPAVLVDHVALVPLRLLVIAMRLFVVAVRLIVIAVCAHIVIA